MKIFEKVVLDCFLCEVKNKRDPLKSAYRRGRGIEDALLYIDSIVILIIQSNMPV